MTIDDQLRDLARRADERQGTITTDDILRRVASRSATVAGSRLDRHRSVLDRRRRALAEHDAPPLDPWRSGHTEHRMGPIRIAIAGLLVAAFVAVAVIRSNDHTRPVDQPSPTVTVTLSPTTSAPPPTTTALPDTASPSGWVGPVRASSTVVQQLEAIAGEVGPVLRWQDPLDAAESWVDVVTVDFSEGTQPHWYIDLATNPPLPPDQQTGLLIAYGLVLDTTDDGVADYLIGIDDSAPRQGDHRVWVTDLATGETVEQVGPPYGYPIEFSHPDERLPDDPPGFTSLVFTFLGDSAPADLDGGTVRFYAWTSATLDDEVVAWDYAPDIGWLTP